MDLRKVQLTGGSSITVTLPKGWVDRVSIKPGDVVGCVQQPDGSLAIYPHDKAERTMQQYEFDVEDTDRDFLFRKIVSAYLMGFNTIKITSRRPLPAEARQAIRDATRRIVGLEIVEEQTSSILLQDFLDPREFHTEKAVRRMAVLTQAMQEEAAQALRDGRAELLASVHDRDNEVDRLYWLVNKQYHAILQDVNYAAKMGLTASQALNYLLLARLLERTADHAVRIASEANGLPRTRVTEALLARVEKQFRRAMELFQRALQTFSRKDARAANAVIGEAERFLESQKKLLKEVTELGGEPIFHLALILESIGRTAAYAEDVGEITINHKVATPS